MLYFPWYLRKYSFGFGPSVSSNLHIRTRALFGAAMHLEVLKKNFGLHQLIFTYRGVLLYYFSVSI